MRARSLVIACGPALALAAAAAAQTQYVRYHDGQQIVMNLDTTQIAVFIEGDTDGSQAVAALTPHGIPAGSIEPMPIPGWSKSGMPPAAGGGGGIVEAVVGAIAAAGQVDFVTPVFLDPDDQPEMCTPRLMVRFGTGVPPSQAESILDPAGAGTIVEADWAGMAGAYLVDSLHVNGFDVMTEANGHAVNPLVVWSHVNWMHRTRGLHVPNDDLFDSAWQFLNTGQSGFTDCLDSPVPDGVPGMDMQATLAWNYQLGDPSIIVAIFDTGIQQDHPDINQVTPGVDLTQVGGDGGPTTDWDNHGTAVAGCVSGIIDNGIGACGIAPGCRSIAMKIASTDEDNGWTWQQEWIVVGLFESFNAGARVTNHSYGTGGPSDAVEDAFEWTRDAGMIHFASAGNGGADEVGDSELLYPARYSTVNAVAALDPDGFKTPWSNWGLTLFISAPGSKVRTTDRTGADGWSGSDYTRACGTSFSGPLTAGAAALILSCDPSLTPAEVETIMADSAMDIGIAGWDWVTGWGFVDVHQAILTACFEGSCIGGPGGSCFEVHSWPGCGDFECCASVCTADPTCCDVLWDPICADMAWEMCGGCELQATGECHEAHGTPGCLDGPCCNSVCNFDPLCCSVEFGWTAACVAHATDLCDHLDPPNDGCINAPQIFDGFTPFSITFASNDGPGQLAECNWDPTLTKDVWYEYLSTCDGILEVSACTQTPFPTWVGVYADCGCPQDTLDLIDCANAEADCLAGEIVEVPVTAGTCYKIRVASGNPDSGGGLVSIKCRVPGDDFDDPSGIPPDGGSDPFSTVGAITDGPPHPGCLPTLDPQIHNDLWWTWTPSASGLATIETCNAADFDTKIAMYAGCSVPPSDANLVACNDDGGACGGGTSSMTVSVTAGQCYLVRVGGASAAATGTGTLTVSFGAPCPWDLDGNGFVDTVDFLALLASWGPCVGCPADFNGDGFVDTIDFLALLANWGACP